MNLPLFRWHAQKQSEHKHQQLVHVQHVRAKKFWYKSHRPKSLPGFAFTKPPQSHNGISCRTHAKSIKNTAISLLQSSCHFQVISHTNNKFMCMGSSLNHNKQHDQCLISIISSHIFMEMSITTEPSLLRAVHMFQSHLFLFPHCYCILDEAVTILDSAFWMAGEVKIHYNDKWSSFFSQKANTI